MSVRVFKNMLGKTIQSIEGCAEGSSELVFCSTHGDKFYFYYEPSCCEDVSIEDVCGDIVDLLDSPILLAEEISQEEPYNPGAESYSWTFYKFATIKGSVTVRWLGTSNGYYGEEADYREELR